MANKKSQPEKEGVPPAEGSANLGDEILKLLYQRTKNPSEAFMLIQQISIYLWDQYQIDWKDQPNYKATETRKQRYMDFVSDLVDVILQHKEPQESLHVEEPPQG